MADRAAIICTTCGRQIEGAYVEIETAGASDYYHHPKCAPAYKEERNDVLPWGNRGIAQ